MYRFINPFLNKRSLIALTCSKPKSLYLNELFKLKTLQNGNKIVNSDFYNNSYDYIFCNEFGEPLPRSTTHNTMMYVTKKLLGKGNELSIHKLKHTHATLLLESNVPMKVIQERLGHKSEAITSDVYSHVTKI
nr:tyrosine-type recombinase/integrase [Staphylococcus epidermidis]